MKAYILSLIVIVFIVYLIYIYRNTIFYCLEKITEQKTQQNNMQNKEKNDVENNVQPQQILVIPPVTSHGFHDHFAKKNKFNNNQLLGWRYWYLNNKSNYMVKPTNNFDNIPTRQYLNDQENVNNWFYNLYGSDNVNNWFYNLNGSAKSNSNKSIE